MPTIVINKAVVLLMTNGDIFEALRREPICPPKKTVTINKKAIFGSK